MNMTATRCAHQTRDVDEQAMLLRGWNQTYQQLSAGRFSGSLVEIDLGDIRIMRELTSHALHQTGALPEDRIALGLLASSPSRPLFCGSLCDDDTLIVFSGSDAFDFHSPGKFEILDFVIARGALDKQLGEAERHALSIQLRKPHLRRLSRDARLQLQQLAHDAFSLATHHTSGHHGPTPLQTRAMHEELLDSLIQALQGGEESSSPATPRARQIGIVGQARALMDGHAPETRLSIQQVCEQLGIARRTLQYAFQDILGMSPLHYQRAQRLNGARQAIKRHQRIADAATAWGFWHFGRFSREYRQLFGELPSETLQRVRRT